VAADLWLRPRDNKPCPVLLLRKKLRADENTPDLPVPASNVSHRSLPASAKDVSQYRRTASDVPSSFAHLDGLAHLHASALRLDGSREGELYELSRSAVGIPSVRAYPGRAQSYLSVARRYSLASDVTCGKARTAKSGHSLCRRESLRITVAHSSPPWWAPVVGAPRVDPQKH
jgi:hypothetical protein